MYTAVYVQVHVLCTRPKTNCPQTAQFSAHRKIGPKLGPSADNRGRLLRLQFKPQQEGGLGLTKSQTVQLGPCNGEWLQQTDGPGAGAPGTFADCRGSSRPSLIGSVLQESFISVLLELTNLHPPHQSTLRLGQVVDQLLRCPPHLRLTTQAISQNIAGTKLRSPT